MKGGGADPHTWSGQHNTQRVVETPPIDQKRAEIRNGTRVSRVPVFSSLFGQLLLQAIGLLLQ